MVVVTDLLTMSSGSCCNVELMKSLNCINCMRNCRIISGYLRMKRERECGREGGERVQKEGRKEKGRRGRKREWENKGEEERECLHTQIINV